MPAHGNPLMIWGQWHPFQDGCAVRRINLYHFGQPALLCELFDQMRLGHFR
jgi:hypothetical protein